MFKIVFAKKKLFCFIAQASPTYDDDIEASYSDYPTDPAKVYIFNLT